jgi:hypothetical protein
LFLPYAVAGAKVARGARQALWLRTRTARQPRQAARQPRQGVMGVARVELFYRCFTCVLHVLYVTVFNLYTNGAQMAAIEGVMALVTGGVTGVASAHAANAPPPQPPACQVARKPLARVTCVLRCKKWASWKANFIGVAQCCSSCSPAPLGGTRQDLYWSKFARDLQ